MGENHNQNTNEHSNNLEKYCIDANYHVATNQQQQLHGATKELQGNYGERMTKNAFFASLVACLGAMSAGTVMTYASPAVPNINSHHNPFHVTKDEQSWIGSIFSLGALVGALFSGPLMHYQGRKVGIMVAIIPFILGWVIIAASPTVKVLYVGRLLTGFCKGLLVGNAHVYIAEISPAATRGMMLSIASVANVCGNLYVYSLGFVLPWTWLAIACAAIPCLMSCAIVFMPETPRYLLLKGNEYGARKALRWLRGPSSDIQKEMNDIRNKIRANEGQLKLREFLQPRLMKPLLISLGLFTVQQFSGNNVLRVYTVTIFQSAGNSINPNVQSIILGGIGVLGALISSAIIDCVGRKVLLVFSSICMAMCLTAAGIYFRIKEADPDFAKEYLAWLPLASLVVDNLSFAVAYDPIPWMIASELFPTRSRGISNSIGGVWQGICFFLVTKFFQDISDNYIHNYGAFWVCAGVCAIGAVFVQVFVPETKQKTLENIENTFS